jgi:hypothetical protein
LTIEHRLARWGGRGAGTVGCVTDVPGDEELVALALAADPEPALGDDAVPIRPLGAAAGDLLPDWYMPAPSTGVRPGWRRRVAVGVVSSILLINAAGLCVTYGPVTFG